MTPQMDDREGWIWYNGKYVEWRDARVHVLSHALHYASSVFEGERAYGGRVFKLRQHSERLLESGRQIDLLIPYSAADLDKITQGVIEKNGLKDAYVRPLAWRGVSGKLSAADPGARVDVMIAAWDMPVYFDATAKANGLTLKVGRLRRPPVECGFPQSKASGGYMMTTVEKHKAIAAGADDALLLDHEGFVAEASAANIFFVKDDQLITPIADRFLNGITRQTVMEIATDMGLRVSERRITLKEIADFDSCFLTGTASEINPVGQVDGVRFSPSEITTSITDAYFKLVYNNARIEGTTHALTR